MNELKIKIMKPKFLISILAFCAFTNCTKSDGDSIDKESSKAGKIIFYTNVQAMLNCGVFDVNVYVDSILVGNISEPYIENNYPDCRDTSYSLLFNTDTGYHSIYAEISCGQYGFWSKEISVNSDECNYCFLDFNECNLIENNSKKGSIIFYTNAQALLNCGPFNVDVFIDSNIVGSLKNAYVDNIKPNCIASDFTIKNEMAIGNYKYYAVPNCGNYNNWSGEFNVFDDSCSYIFLDINSLTQNQ